MSVVKSIEPLRDISQLSRKERVDIRNQIIISQVYSGVDKEDVARQFTISVRQLDRIIKQVDDANQEWYNNLLRNGMSAMFRYNSMQVFDEIATLKSLRNQTAEPEKKFDMTQGIINSIISYNKMLAEGPTYARMMELVKKTESKSRC